MLIYVPRVMNFLNRPWSSLQLLFYPKYSFLVFIKYILCLFLQIAQEYSECPSGKKGGDLGWFPRGKMAGPFQEVAFNTVIGATSAPFKSTYVLIFVVNSASCRNFFFRISWF